MGKRKATNITEASSFEILKSPVYSGHKRFDTFIVKVLRICQSLEICTVRRSENDFFDVFNPPHLGKYVVRLG